MEKKIVILEEPQIEELTVDEIGEIDELLEAYGADAPVAVGIFY